MARPYIPHLDMVDIQPTSRAPGRQSFLLSRDPETTARTAVQRIVPTGEFKAEPMAHFHHTTEEILVLEGLMSFDSRAWLSPMSYVYHPSEFVHGFASAVPMETLYISRTGADLDFNYVPEPLALSPYFVGETPGTRPLVTRLNALGGPWDQLTAPGRHPNWLQTLSRDTADGGGSALVRLGAGNRLNAIADHPGEREIFVLEGAMTGNTGERFVRYSYGCWPAGFAQPGFLSEHGVLLYLHCQVGMDAWLTASGLAP